MSAEKRDLTKKEAIFFLNGVRARGRPAKHDWPTIIRRRLAGETGASLAREFGISEAYMSHGCRRYAEKIKRGGKK